MDAWGSHVALDCAGGNDNIKDRQQVYDFVKELVPAIDMKAFGEPIIEHFAAHAEDKAGFSLVQLIETSCITAHFVNSNGDFYLDIFSCKHVDANIAIEVVKKYFAPKSIKQHYLVRQAQYMKIVLNRKQIAKLNEVVDHFTEINKFTIETDNSDAGVSVVFDLFDVDAKPSFPPMGERH